MPKIKLSKIASMLKAELIGKDRLVSGLNDPIAARTDELILIFEKRWLKNTDAIKSKAWIIHEAMLSGATEYLSSNEISYCAVREPYEAMVSLLELFYPSVKAKIGSHQTVIKGRSVRIGKSVSIGAFSSIGSRVIIGKGTSIGEHVVIGSDVRIGEACYIYPNVTLYDGTVIGDRVIIHAGSVIGSDGFGFYQKSGQFRKIPHHGSVLIEENVEIGANCCVDRGTLGVTRIGKGCKLDNLVQIAHNVVIGEHTVIAAQVGIAGSTTIGSHVTIGGQAGIVGHITIGDGVTIAAQSGVIGSIQAGITVSGYPAREHQEALRREAYINRIPEVLNQLKKK